MGLTFRGNPVEVRISYPVPGYISISLVCLDDFEKTYIDLTVEDDFYHAIGFLKELLEYYES